MAEPPLSTVSSQMGQPRPRGLQVPPHPGSQQPPGHLLGPAAWEGAILPVPAGRSPESIWHLCLGVPRGGESVPGGCSPAGRGAGRPTGPQPPSTWHLRPWRTSQVSSPGLLPAAGPSRTPPHTCPLLLPREHLTVTSPILSSSWSQGHAPGARGHSQEGTGPGREGEKWTLGAPAARPHLPSRLGAPDALAQP